MEEGEGAEEGLGGEDGHCGAFWGEGRFDAPRWVFCWCREVRVEVGTKSPCTALVTALALSCGIS